MSPSRKSSAVVLGLRFSSSDLVWAVQVFPLDRNDCVHTRLTHSYEVSNLARSIDTYLAFSTDLIPADVNPQRNLPAILAATGLAHDLGNPPFGHQGEQSIQFWFKQNENVLRDDSLDESMRKDFLIFEGNAQTLRILTKLQVQTDDFGLNWKPRFHRKSGFPNQSKSVSRKSLHEE